MKNRDRNSTDGKKRPLSPAKTQIEFAKGDVGSKKAISCGELRIKVKG